jgi:hypothetical protein
MAIIKAETTVTVTPPVNTPALTPAAFAKGKNTVTVEFPKPVLFTPAHGTKVQYTPGTHEVPREFAQHWYLQAHGARVYSKPVSVVEQVEKARGKKNQ